MSHKAITIRLLKRGWLTAMESARQGGCHALAQRVSELRAAGEFVADKWVKTPGGARIKAYKLIQPTRWTA
ncbi:MAG: helix-turn-helix domain-containing protein [Caldilineaceae bacterium]